MSHDLEKCFSLVKDYEQCEAWDLPHVAITKQNICSVTNVDFETYRSSTDCILLYYTLDIHKAWKKILINALESCKSSIIIVKDVNYRHNDDIDFLFRLYNIRYEYLISDNKILFIGQKIAIQSSLKIQRTAVCTCIYGNYDELRAIPPYNRNDVDFICFTDNPNMPKDRGWIIDTNPYHAQDLFMQINGRISIQKSKGQTNHPNIIAKYYKMCLGRIPRLQMYNRIMYIDGSFEFLDISILDDFKDKEFMMYRHIERDRVQAEADQACLWQRYVQQPVKEQVASYFEEGFEDTCLLLAGFALRPNNDYYNRMFCYWFYETQKWTDLCQVSIPYICWLFNKTPFINQDMLFVNKYCKFHHHKYAY